MTRAEKYAHDELMFQKWLMFQKLGLRLIALDCGLGDHYVFRQAVELKPTDIVACCYPEVFPERKCISIEDAWQLADLRPYNIYAWCINNNWTGTLHEAFKKRYEHLNHTR